MAEQRRIQPAPGIKRVPFPGGGQHLTSARRLTWGPYWQRYLDEGIVVDAPLPPVVGAAAGTQPKDEE